MIFFSARVCVYDGIENLNEICSKSKISKTDINAILVSLKKSNLINLDEQNKNIVTTNKGDRVLTFFCENPNIINNIEKNKQNPIVTTIY